MEVATKEVRVSFTVSSKSELVGKPASGFKNYWGVEVISIAEGGDDGSIIFRNPPNIDVEAGVLVTIKGPREKVYEVLRKGIVD